MAALATHSRPSIPRRVWPLIAFVLWAWVLAFAPRDARGVDASPVVVDPSLPVLKSITEVYSVAAPLNAAPHQVDLEVLVAYYDLEWNVAYIIDDDALAQFAVPAPGVRLQSGDVVRMTGVMRPEQAATQWRLGDFNITRLRRGESLNPTDLQGNLSELLRTNPRMVRCEAFVEGQELADASHPVFTLIIEGQRIIGRAVIGGSAPVPDFDGQIITLEGVLVPERGFSPEFMAQLFIGDLGAVESHGLVVDHPDFSIPTIPIKDISTFRSGQRVHIEGKVTTLSTDRDILIDDGVRPVRIITSQRRFVAHGQRIEVVGVPVRTPYGWQIARPYVRPSVIEAPASAGSEAAAPAVSNAPVDAPNQLIAPEALPEVTSMQQLWNIEATRKDWLHRVNLLFHVGYADAGWQVMWAENEGAATFISVQRTDIDFRSGQVIRIQGLHRPNRDLRITPDLQVEIVEPYRAMAPIKVSGVSADDRLTSRLISVTGLVERQTEIDQYHAALDLTVDGIPVTARCRLSESERIPDYTGHIVSLEGVWLPQTDAGKLVKGDLWVGRVSAVRSLGTLAADPSFNVTTVRVEDLATTPADQMVRLVGQVRSVAPGKPLTFEDDSGLINITTGQMRGVAANTPLEVRGYPTRDGPSWTLSRPLFRPIAAGGSSARAPARATYRLAEDVLELGARADAKMPVKLNAVVTWSNPLHRFFFVRDASGGIQVIRPDSAEPQPPTAGTAVVIEGETAFGDYVPVIRARTFSSGATLGLSDPPLISVEQARTGSEEAQRIKLAGYVKRVRHDGSWTHLDVISPSGIEFQATLPRYEEADVLQHAIVRLAGVCQGGTNGAGRIERITLWMNSPSEIEELDRADENLFARETSSIADLWRYAGQRRGATRVHVTGRVIAAVPGHGFFLRDDVSGIEVVSDGEEPPKVGQAVSVVGLLGHDGHYTVVREPSFRVIGVATSPPVVVVNSSELINPQYDCQLVAIEATLLESSLADGFLRLNLVKGVTTFEGVLHVPSRASLPAGVVPPPGSRLRVTGVYRIDPADGQHVDRFNLILRSTADLSVLQQPPWLTVERAKTLGITLLLVILAAFGWVYFLRRRVQHQTGQIRKQLVKEARLEDRQRNIIEKASDFIFMIDLAGGFTLFNPAGEAITGYSRKDASNLSIFDLLAESDRVRLRDGLLKAKPGGEIPPFQTQFRRRDGSQVWVEVAARFLSEEDRVTGALCVARDITERKRVEEELKRARDAAEANTKAKSAFLANMSHEIRTPMNGVIGMSNLLLDTHLTHDQRDFALTIRNSAEALLTVLNDILDFSKIEAGKLQFETLDFDLTEAVDDTLDLLAARAASKHLELAALIPASIPQKLRGDPGRLRQILLNLVGNAIKFTETGDVSVGVRVERATPRSVLLRFDVRDTGIGISREEQEKLFMPFSQADASTTRKYGGTGLGLAICRQIIDQMNGQIGVMSEPGRGSTFWFTVEFARGSAKPLEPAPESLRGLRVLGVDDNQINRTVIQHYLEPAGVRIDLASTAQDALGALRAAAAAGDPFRLVLLDYHMPEMDGIGLARAIHEDPRLGGLAMALLTSVDRRFTSAELAAVGISASMAKPIRQRELMQTIQRSLSAETHPAPIVARPSEPAASMPVLRVLVAEDNPVNQRLTRIQLRKLGYEADLACNGLEVLEAFERVSYDVIFMDCQMPELDGYDTARRLAKHPRRGDVRIVAMTANAMQGDRDKCLESGMDDYLSKPTRPEDLAAALRRAAEAIARPV